MFIELTDHLRCPADHPEAYLVLLPDRTEGRDVQAGHLGCPICGWNTDFTNGEVDFGGGVPAVGTTAFTAEAIQAFLGLGGPGGYVALAGNATEVAGSLAEALKGIHLVLVNPRTNLAPGIHASSVRSSLIPLQTGSMRGVALGADVAGMDAWVREALRVTLPGLRVIGEGKPPEVSGLELLATGGNAWVGRKESAIVKSSNR